MGLTLPFLSNRQLRMVLDGKSSQKNLADAGVPQGSLLAATVFLLYINNLAALQITTQFLETLSFLDI